MSASAIASYFVEHWLEIGGMVATLLGIWLTTKRLLICWPITLLADFLYLVVFYQARLLSDSLLQIFFVVFTLYGWWHWWRGVRQEGEVRVEPLSARGVIAGLAAGAVGAVLLGWLMVRIGAALLHVHVEESFTAEHGRPRDQRSGTPQSYFRCQYHSSPRRNTLTQNVANKK